MVAVRAVARPVLPIVAVAVYWSQPRRGRRRLRRLDICHGGSRLLVRGVPRQVRSQVREQVLRHVYAQFKRFREASKKWTYDLQQYGTCNSLATLNPSVANHLAELNLASACHMQQEQAIRTKRAPGSAQCHQ